MQEAKQSVNSMKQVRVSKVTLSIACGESGEKLERAYKLAERLTGKTPVRTRASRKARTFRVRYGLPIGVKVTLRRDEAIDFLKMVLPAKDNIISLRSFDNEGNFAFGISEYLDIPGQKYDPSIGMFGMNVVVTLERPGFRVKRRKLKKSTIGSHHRIAKQEAVSFVKDGLGLNVE